jgi:hypothetical protein
MNSILALPGVVDYKESSIAGYGFPFNLENQI